MLIMVTARITTEEQRDAIHNVIIKHPKVADWYRHMGNQWVIALEDISIYDFNDYLGNAFEDDERPTLLVNTLHSYNGWHSKEFWTFIKKHKTLAEPEATGKAAKAKPDDEYTLDPADYEVRDALTLDSLDLDEASDEIVTRYFQRMAFFKHAADKGFSLPENHQNLIISGKTGVGKSTLAKAIGLAFAAQNTQRKVPVYFVKIAQIIGRYRGHTQKNMQALLDMAENGIIIFDEIDTFLDIDSDDKNALNVLNTHLTDKPNEPVILGTIYEHNRARFFDFNTGMKSRFPSTIIVPEQDSRTLSKIFEAAVTDTGMPYDPAIVAEVENLVQQIRTAQRSNFGHIREVENIMGAVITNMAARHAADPDGFEYYVTLADIPVRDRQSGELVARKIEAAKNPDHVADENATAQSEDKTPSTSGGVIPFPHLDRK